jgi:hypothetical protein
MQFYSTIISVDPQYQMQMECTSSNFGDERRNINDVLITLQINYTYNNMQTEVNIIDEPKK